MRLEASISDGNRRFFQIYPPCAFLITNIFKYVVVHIVHCIAIGIAVNEIFILYRHF
jgi:hypothetical protein